MNPVSELSELASPRSVAASTSPVSRDEARQIAIWAVAAAVVGLIIAFLVPNQYTAQTKIIPPQQPQSSATAVLGQLGALAGFASKDLGLKNPADLYVGILRSQTIADELIKRFDLQRYYRKKYASDTRKELDGHTDIDVGKDGLISLKFTSKDPNLSAAVANAYIEQLYSSNQRLAITDASQRRLFFQKQLELEKNALADSEVELKKTQEATGLIEVTGQADAIIRSVAQMEAQIAGKQVQLQAVRSSATEDNPEVIRLKAEIAALEQQLANLEKNNRIGGC